MPKREDDFWASQKEGLRYCVKHKRYYRADVGCQICMFERLGTTPRGQQHLRLLLCPDCHENSLFWNDSTQLYECLNLNCKHTFNKSEFEARKLQVQTEEPDESRKEEDRPELQQCPVCKEETLFWNGNTQLYECLNVKCKRRLTEAELTLVRQGKLKLASKPKKSVAYETRKPKHTPSYGPGYDKYMTLEETSRAAYLAAERQRRAARLHSTKKPRPRGMRIGLGTRKFLMSIAKLSLCLLVIAGIGLIAWTGYQLFMHQIAPVIGTIVFLAEIGLLIWIISVLRSSRFRWRKPSFKLVFWSLIVIALVCAFAGIEPMSSTKDRVVSFVEQGWETITAPTQSPTPAPVKPTPTPAPPVSPSPTPTPPPAKLSLSVLEEETFKLINMERNAAGLPSTKWDVELYKLSKAHTEAMADRGELFHTPMGASYGENAWGAPWGGIDRQELAKIIVDNWMSSPLHRAWILHESLRSSVVSIVDDDRGQYASWTFWVREAGEGPALVKKAYNLWQEETGGDIPWLEWLYDVKGYPYNTEFLE